MRTTCDEVKPGVGGQPSSFGGGNVCCCLCTWSPVYSIPCNTITCFISHQEFDIDVLLHAAKDGDAERLLKCLKFPNSDINAVNKVRSHGIEVTGNKNSERSTHDVAGVTARNPFCEIRNVSLRSPGGLDCVVHSVNCLPHKSIHWLFLLLLGLLCFRFTNHMTSFLSFFSERKHGIAYRSDPRQSRHVPSSVRQWC